MPWLLDITNVKAKTKRSAVLGRLAIIRDKYGDK